MNARFVCAFALSLFALGATPRAALACGGCLGPPPDPRMPTGVQTVTDHRMVLSLSLTQTTLWDQFSWSGDPTQFSWVLPIVNGAGVTVDLASDDFLTMLDNLSSPTSVQPSAPTRACTVCVHPPPRYCPGQEPVEAGVSSDASSGDSSDGGVVVLRQAVLGPYELVVLSSSDPTALRSWLSSHSFVVPASLDPTLQFYIDRHMDFVALRLIAAAGVTRMQPVRVTVPGYQPGLPLRMISAGVADRVGLLLFTLSTARVQTDNFPNTQVGEGDLDYDFASTLAFDTVFRGAERRLSLAAGDRAWSTEYARPVTATALTAAAGPYDVTPPGADSGTMRALAASDVAAARAGVGEAMYLTRLRSDLPVAALDRDLMLSAAPDGAGERDRAYRYGVLHNMPNPAACAPLDCRPGDTMYQTTGYVTGPYGELLAPTTVFGATYVLGSAPEIPRPAIQSSVVPGDPPALMCDAGLREGGSREGGAGDGGFDAGAVSPTDGGTDATVPDGDAGAATPPRASCQCATALGAPGDARASGLGALAGLGALLAWRRRRARS